MSDEQKPPAMCTTSGEPVEKVRAEQTEATGQHKSYVVLCPDERAKGFVRPYRDAFDILRELQRAFPSRRIQVDG